MIFYRNKDTKGNFIIKDVDGNIVRTPQTLQYIKSLVIPPAYTNVKIYNKNNPKILFEGYDSKNRKQQIYSKQWKLKTEKQKFKKLLEFGRNLSEIRRDVDKWIKSTKVTKNKIISVIIKIISACYFRIGNAKYQKLYGSFGISTILKRHLKMVKTGMQINFIGKKGIKNSCLITDSIVINEMLQLSKDKLPGDKIFTFVENKKVHEIKATEINDWLRQYGGATSKMFRTFDTNALLIQYFRENPVENTPAKRKKNMIAALKHVSELVHNTPSVCKKEYAHVKLIDAYLNHPRQYNLLFNNKLPAEQAFTNFLEKTHK
jgi:DNA topoisomerase-1